MSAVEVDCAMESVLPICRICLNACNEVINFQANFECRELPAKNNSKELNYLECLRLCTNLPLEEDDGGPQCLCTSCEEELQVVFKFLQKAETSQAILSESSHKHISNKETVEHTEISIEKFVRNEAVNDFEDLANVELASDSNQLSNDSNELSNDSNTEDEKFDTSEIDIDIVKMEKISEDEILDTIVEDVGIAKMDKINVNDQDFSADDDVCDPNYRPTKVIRNIRNIVLESEPAVSAKRMRSTGRSPKLIFNPEFYVAMVMYTNGSTTAKCVACHKLIKGTREVSSNFISHLKVRHSELHKKYMRMKAGPSDESTSQEAFEKKIIRFLVDCALPVSVVEKESFRDLFSGTGLKVMCQKTAMKRLDETYNSMVTTVKTAMSSSKYFCTTADIWSGNHRSFLGYTCHWLDQNFQRKSGALACKRIFGVHSAEKIAQMIGDINTSFGLNTINIIMTITDNGSNFVKAFRDHGLRQSDYNGKQAEEDSEDEMPIFENAKYLPKHERCASHTLNLLATTDFQRIFREQPALYIQHTMTIKKCHQLWKKCKWPKSSEVIRNILGSALLVPVVTRWNSLYDAILKLLQFKEKLHELANELALPPFSAGDFQYLESYKLLMEPIAQTLDFLQGESNVKYGCIIPALLSLSNKLLKLSRKPEVLGNISSIAVQLEHQLRVRFKLYFTLAPEVNMAIAAAVLTPNVKMKWLRVIQKTSPDCTEEQITKRVLEVICNLFKNGFSYNATDVPNLNNDNSFYDFDDDEDDVPKTPVTPTKYNGFKNAISNQFYAYLNDPDPGPEIWTKYNVLKEAFVLCNTPLTSSAPVERLFSFAGIINSPRRNSLSDFSFEKLVLMKSNVNFL